jgi:hypothetical protein
MIEEGNYLSLPDPIRVRVEPVKSTNRPGVINRNHLLGSSTLGNRGGLLLGQTGGRTTSGKPVEQSTFKLCILYLLE